MIKFHQSKETLNKIRDLISKKEKGAYFRFGDGDINLADGSDSWDCFSNDMTLPENKRLIKEMQECFAYEDPGILKTLPLYCSKYNGLEPGMFPGNHECSEDWCDRIVSRVQKWWNPIDVYSHCALHYLATTNPDQAVLFLKQIKGSNVQLFIGNSSIPDNIIKQLFGVSCKFIAVPDRTSSIIDSLEQNILDNFDEKKYGVIVLAAGCVGRVLQKRLYQKLKGCFSIDIGSFIDALCGKSSRAWIELTKFDKESFISRL